MVIRIANKDEYAAIAKLHQEAFPHFFMTSLGIDYLIGHYQALLKHPNTLCFVVEEKGQLIGFVMGRADARNGLTKVVKTFPLHFVMLGLKLFVKSPSSFVRVLKNLSKKNNGLIKDAQDYSEIGLIGVKSNIKGKGIGHKLFNAFCNEAKKQGASKISVTTDFYNNDDVLNSYKAWGLEVYYDFISYPDRKMYRLIKNLD